MQKYLLLLVLIVFSQSFVAMKVYAGPPFCLNGPGMQPQCTYYSANSCRDAASRITRGFCDVNDREIELPKGPGAWCLVTSTRQIQCYYENFRSCRNQTRSKNAICARSSKRPSPSKEFESNVENLF